MYHKSQVKARTAQNAAYQLQDVVAAQESNTTVAGVSRGLVAPVYLGQMDPVSISHTAGTGAAEIIKFGDYFGVIATANNIGTITEYSNSGNIWTATQFASWIEKGLLVAEINYVVSDKSQFSNPWKYNSTDASGAQGGRNIAGRFAAAQRSTDQNLLVKTLDLRADGKQLLLNSANAMFVTVGAGITVDITFTFGAVRQGGN